MKSIIDNAAGPTGVSGIVLGKWYQPEAFISCIPGTPSEWLIFFSTGLVICQLVHWGWRFARWAKKREEGK